VAVEKAFGAADWYLIDSFRPVVDALAALFGEGCEVVLHGFHSPASSVVHIANGIAQAVRWGRRPPTLP